MQEEEKKTVDIDTSGPDVEVELPEEKKRRRCCRVCTCLDRLFL